MRTVWVVESPDGAARMVLTSDGVADELVATLRAAGDPHTLRRVPVSDSLPVQVPEYRAELVYDGDHRSGPRLRKSIGMLWPWEAEADRATVSFHCVSPAAYGGATVIRIKSLDVEPLRPAVDRMLRVVAESGFPRVDAAWRPVPDSWITS